MKMFFLIILFHIHCLAETIQISSPNISNEEFNAYYDTHRENGPSFVNFYLQKYPVYEHVKNLNSLYVKAIGYYFAKSRASAMNYFLQIIDLSLNEDWHAHQREMIFNSFLRLAELVPIKSEDYLKKAIAFDPTLKPNSQFTQTIRNDFENMKRILKKRAFALSLTDFKKFDKMILNGREIDLKNTEIEILPGQYRITIISNKYKPSTFIFSSQQMMILDSPAIPFVDGSCVANETSDYFQNSNIKVYNPKCAKEQKFLPVSKNTNDFLKTSATEPNTKTIFEKPWFWAAAGAVVGFLIVSNLNQKSGPTSETIHP